ncbi:hypothetical protein FQR65_LT11055 [Abscondita terminalis]|nr:hypothetical protein FQR65_LT11055 [Abscondita terminalis]
MVMYASILVIAVLCAGVSGAPQNQAKNGINNFLDQVDAVRKDVEHTIKQHLPDTQEVTNVLINVSKDFAVSIEKGVKDLSEQVQNNKVVDNIVQDLSKGISNSVNFLKGLAGEDATKKGEEIKKSLQTHLDNILEGGKKLQEALQPQLEKTQDQIKSFTGNFIQEFASAGERLKSEIDKAIDAHKAKH